MILDPKESASGNEKTAAQVIAELRQVIRDNGAEILRLRRHLDACQCPACKIRRGEMDA